MRYDVVIIGAGSAGNVLATRLSEDKERSVLLLEAGPDYQTSTASPMISDLAMAPRPPLLARIPGDSSAPPTPIRMSR